MAENKRKPISKKMRFEVFKRDRFTCQYCGMHAPDVVLECDHIKPVAEGGKNTILNLVTACRDCNRGKGKTLIDDTSAVEIQFQRMSELSERREQMKMLLEWRNELAEMENEQIDAVSNIICDSGYCLGEKARQKTKTLIHKYGFDEVLTAAEIARDKYIIEQNRGVSFAFDKIGGICYNRANHIGSDKYGY